ncbi:MAG TPA: hypothetical protein VGQ61_00610, partial [Candidatus Angelobacter sp.]|nr:hypothetical protein [Candidatus Angelobacter sp.]
RKFFILGDDENIHLNLSGETSLKIFFRALAGPRVPISSSAHAHCTIAASINRAKWRGVAGPGPPFSRVKT